MAPLSTLSYVELHALVRLIDAYGVDVGDGKETAWKEMAFAELRRRFDAIDEGLRLEAEARAAREQSH